MKQEKKLIVHKSGCISGIGRYTEIPFAALEQSDFNMMFPDESEEKEFAARESSKES